MPHTNLLAACACGRYSTYSPCGRCRFHARVDRMSLADKGFVPSAKDIISPAPVPFADLHTPATAPAEAPLRHYVPGHTLTLPSPLTLVSEQPTQLVIPTRKPLLVRFAHLVFGARGSTGRGR